MIGSKTRNQTKIINLKNSCLYFISSQILFRADDISIATAFSPAYKEKSSSSTMRPTVVIYVIVLLVAGAASWLPAERPPLRRASDKGGFGFRKGSADRFGHLFGKRQESNSPDLDGMLLIIIIVSLEESLGEKPLGDHPFMTFTRMGRDGQAQVDACGWGRGHAPCGCPH